MPINKKLGGIFMTCNLCNKNINKIEERDHTLYMHVSPNNKRYIGITHTDVERRWNSFMLAIL